MPVSTHAVQFEFTAVFRTRNSLNTATRRKPTMSAGDLSLVVVHASQQQRGRDVKPLDHVMWVHSEMLCVVHVDVEKLRAQADTSISISSIVLFLN